MAAIANQTEQSEVVFPPAPISALKSPIDTRVSEASRGLTNENPLSQKKSSCFTWIKEVPLKLLNLLRRLWDFLCCKRGLSSSPSAGLLKDDGLSKRTPLYVEPLDETIDYFEFTTRATILLQSIESESRREWPSWTEGMSKLGPLCREYVSIISEIKKYEKDLSKHAEFFKKLDFSMRVLLARKANQILNMVSLIQNLEGDTKRDKDAVPLASSLSLMDYAPSVLSLMSRLEINPPKAEEALAYLMKLKASLQPTRSSAERVSNKHLGLQNSGNLCYVIACLQVMLNNPRFREAIQKEVTVAKFTIDRSHYVSEEAYQKSLRELTEKASKEAKTLEEMRKGLLTLHESLEKGNFERASQAASLLRLNLFKEGVFADYIENLTAQRDAAGFLGILFSIARPEPLIMKRLTFKREKEALVPDGSLQTTQPESLMIPCISEGRDLSLQGRINAAFPLSEIPKRDFLARDYLTTAPLDLVLQLGRYVVTNASLSEEQCMKNIQKQYPDLNEESLRFLAQEEFLGGLNHGFRVSKIATPYPLPEGSFTLNLRECIDPAVERGLPIHYDLKACILHLGSSPQMGHYTAVVKQSEGWFYYNDEVVVKISEERARALFAEAYLIFGERLLNERNN